ncbi:hypothetical protein BFC19_12225 (plasmid) [Brochothrix thermosphacta]|uniref:hypothetical protein n=1 Tax=Brochothrix thermosphacta TaxID=2756 RepID=UPI000E76D6E3|nr:hypothetical protein [Brochothrix thermosphacta]ANZ96202.1 hypothetical protein BFC19_12225 [Brochothrix thermosphacta]
MKKIILSFTLVSILFLVACGGNSYQSEIDEAVKIMNDEGHTDIKKDNSSFYVYNEGAIIMVDDGSYKRYVEKQQDGEYAYEPHTDRVEKSLPKNKSDTDYAEKNGKEIKK